MWRTAPLIALCLSACHHSAAPPPPAATKPPAEEPVEAEARCTRDEDCALTLLSEEGCCPMLCTPRAISTTALARQQKSCANVPESSCPEPMCRPPSGAPSPACQKGRCTVRLIPMD